MKKEQKLTTILFLVYLCLLTWIILFKMQLSPSTFPHIRSVNLIPFSESVITNGKIDIDEIINNMIAFIPVGIYLGMLMPHQGFIKKLLPVMGLSLAYEMLQFIFSIGATDITDIIMNTLGGALGLLILIPLTRLYGKKAMKILNILAVICTCMIVGLMLLLILGNL